VLTVNAIHEDASFTKQVRHDVDDEVQALASWLGSSCVADRALRPPPLGLTAQ